MTSRLTTCKTCGKSVSISAPTCPHCGEPNPAQKDEKSTLETERAKTSAPRKENIAGMLGASIFGLLAIVAIFIIPSKDVTTKNKVPQSIEAATTATYKPDAVSDAFGVCAVFDGTGLTTQCEVKSATLSTPPSVDVTIDTNGSDARKMCAGIADMMAKQTHSFAGKWRLRIFSPYSGQRPIATCALR